MKTYGEYEITASAPLAKGIRDITVYCPDAAKTAHAGQFAQIYVNGADTLLARPISICDAAGDSLRFVFKVVGVGTARLSHIKPGRNLRLIAPLGNGFPLTTAPRVALVGGGLGVPPLLKLAKELAAESPKRDIHAFLGFSGEPFLTGDFEKIGGVKTHIATDDGIEGFMGTAVDMIDVYINEGNAFDIIYACGPRPMLKALTQTAQTANARLLVSTEERMACGIGACVGCAIKVKAENGFTYKKVCADGPVFDAADIIWD